MAIPVNEVVQENVPESLVELITNADIGTTPVQAMFKKSMKKTSEDDLTSWGVKKHRSPNLKGVPDLQDVNKFNHNPRKKLYGIRQKSRDGVAVGDLASLNTVAGVSDEMVDQTDESLVVLARSIEGRILCNHDCRDEDDGSEGKETRGAGSWLDTAEQATLPVPTGYRPAARSVVPFDEFDEDALKALSLTAYGERKGKAKMVGCVGIQLKSQISTWLSVQKDVTSKHNVRAVNQDASSKAYIECVDRIEIDSADIDLMVSDFLFLTNAEEAASTFATSYGGLFLMKDMWNLDFARDLRLIQMANQGGGDRAYADAVYTLECLNPLGQFSYIPTALT